MQKAQIFLKKFFGVFFKIFLRNILFLCNFYFAHFFVWRAAFFYSVPETLRHRGFFFCSRNFCFPTPPRGKSSSRSRFSLRSFQRWKQAAIARASATHATNAKPSAHQSAMFSTYILYRRKINAFIKKFFGRDYFSDFFRFF